MLQDSRFGACNLGSSAWCVPLVTSCAIHTQKEEVHFLQVCRVYSEFPSSVKVSISITCLFPTLNKMKLVWIHLNVSLLSLSIYFVDPAGDFVIFYQPRQHHSVGKRPPEKFLESDRRGYYISQNIEKNLGKVWRSALLQLPPYPLWSGVVVPDRDLSIGQINLPYIYIYIYHHHH